MVLTRAQKDLALQMAQLKLLEQPGIHELLGKLQCQCLVDVARMVKAEHNLPADYPCKISF